MNNQFPAFFFGQCTDPATVQLSVLFYFSQGIKNVTQQNVLYSRDREYRVIEEDFQF
jgi:hypothetical protein